MLNIQRTIGTVVRGIRAPIITAGDDLVSIVTQTLFNTITKENIVLNKNDVLAITEAVVAKAQGNYATIDQIAIDVKSKFPSGEFAIVFPILSRNRFSVCFKGILKAAKKVTLMLSYPADEVGNELVSLDLLDEKGINPYTDVLTEKRFRELFGSIPHPFTGVDYISYYRSLAEEMGVEMEIIFANDPKAILNYKKDVLCCDIHTNKRTRRIIQNAGCNSVYSISDVLAKPVLNSGFNKEFGLLGSNKASETSVKLFPRDSFDFVNMVQKQIIEKTGVEIHVMVYGDGAFKDPVGKIWELADPVVSPGYTSGLIGTPNEIKLKYVADNDFKNLKGDQLNDSIIEYIRQKKKLEKTEMTAMGTTPRRLTDLIGSLCDLTTGSGDKGTPFVLIQGYFDNLAN